MTAGYSGTPLPRKLGIKPGHRLVVSGAPSSFEDALGPLDPSVRRVDSFRSAGPFDVVIVFVRNRRELRARFERGRDRLESAGGLWVAWPKQSSPLATDLRESDIRSYGLSTGLVDNKVCAIDQDWSGLRFVVRRKDRPKPAR